MKGKVLFIFVATFFIGYGPVCAQSLPENTPAAVPTMVTKIIDPDNGPGTDYTSLEAFATAEKRDLVAAGEIAVALCRSSNGSPDGPAQFDGWVTDSEHYVIVMADSAHRAGAAWDESKYRIVEQSSGNSECIDVEIDYIVIDGIQMRLSGSGTNNDVIDVQGNNALLIVKNCFIWMDITTVSGTGMDPKNSLEVYNCIFKSSGGGSSAIYLKNSSSTPAGTIVNNTFVGGWEHAIRSEGSCLALNNLVRDCQTTEVFLASDGGSFTADSDYNSTNHSGAALVNSPRQSTSAPWFNGSFSDGEIFIDAGSDNYHLKTDAPVAGVGIGPDGNAIVPVTDIEGDARTGPDTDLGADAIGAATPDISVSPASVDFGGIVLGNQASQTITVQNSGDAALDVSSIQVTGTGAVHFSLAGAAAFVLLPGESATVTVIFEPGQTGVHSAALQIDSNDPDQLQVVLPLQGEGVEAVFSVNMNAGWNLIGLPLATDDSTASALLPGHTPGTLFTFTAQYQPDSVLARGRGAWIFYEQPATETITGGEIREIQVELLPGWNLISGPACDVEVSQISDPNGILSGDIFEYNSVYSIATTLQQGRGYWVFATGSGPITITCP